MCLVWLPPHREDEIVQGRMGMGFRTGQALQVFEQAFPAMQGDNSLYALRFNRGLEELNNAFPAK